MSSDDDIIAATQRGDLKAVDRLLENPEIDSMDIIDAVVISIQSGYLDIFKRFLSVSWINFWDIDGVLTKPAIEGDLEMLDLILRKISPPPLSEYNQALIQGSRYGHSKIVERLLKERSDPSASWQNRRRPTVVQDNHSLILASWENHWDVVRLLLKDDRVLEKYQLYLN